MKQYEPDSQLNNDAICPRGTLHHSTKKSCDLGNESKLPRGQMHHFDIMQVDSIDSTNNAIKQAIHEGKPEGTALVAREQTGGYGRQGRHWSSPEGGLYCSLLLRPFDHGIKPEQLPPLSLVISLAIRQTLANDALCPGGVLTHCPGQQNQSVNGAGLTQSKSHSFAVKWPNDVLYEGKKIVGISVEAIEGAVCVGFGVNVFRPANEQSVGGKNQPVYYAEIAALEFTSHQKFIYDLAVQILEGIGEFYARWLEQGFSVFNKEYNTHSYLMGKIIQVVDQLENPLVEGKVEGCDKQGNLLVRDNSGVLHPVASGEAHLTYL